MTETERRWWMSIIVCESGCWECKTPNKANRGYGRFRLNGKQEYAHRAAYTMHVGEIPAGLLVCHKCDNPSCVKPSHLFVGTKADNANDMFAKGRVVRPFGENQPRHKLTDATVIELRRRWEGGEPLKRLAREFGVCATTAVKAVRRETWRHL